LITSTGVEMLARVKDWKVTMTIDRIKRLRVETRKAKRECENEMAILQRNGRNRVIRGDVERESGGGKAQEHANKRIQVP